MQSWRLAWSAHMETCAHVRHQCIWWTTNCLWTVAEDIMWSPLLFLQVPVMLPLVVENQKKSTNALVFTMSPFLPSLFEKSMILILSLMVRVCVQQCSGWNSFVLSFSNKWVSFLSTSTDSYQLSFTSIACFPYHLTAPLCFQYTGKRWW